MLGTWKRFDAHFDRVEKLAKSHIDEMNEFLSGEIPSKVKARVAKLRKEIDEFYQMFDDVRKAKEERSDKVGHEKKYIGACLIDSMTHFLKVRYDFVDIRKLLEKKKCPKKRKKQP